MRVAGGLPAGVNVEASGHNNKVKALLAVFVTSLIPTTTEPL